MQQGLVGPLHCFINQVLLSTAMLIYLSILYGCRAEQLRAYGQQSLKYYQLIFTEKVANLISSPRNRKCRIQTVVLQKTGCPCSGSQLTNWFLYDVIPFFRIGYRPVIQDERGLKYLAHGLVYNSAQDMLIDKQKHGKSASLCPEQKPILPPGSFKVTSHTGTWQQPGDLDLSDLILSASLLLPSVFTQLLPPQCPGQTGL